MNAPLGRKESKLQALVEKTRSSGGEIDLRKAARSLGMSREDVLHWLSLYDPSVKTTNSVRWNNSGRSNPDPGREQFQQIDLGVANPTEPKTINILKEEPAVAKKITIPVERKVVPALKSSDIRSSIRALTQEYEGSRGGQRITLLRKLNELETNLRKTIDEEKQGFREI